ncbi:ankyrin repeat domain-containing protein, partial [Klebsiella pneumoniae]
MDPLHYAGSEGDEEVVKLLLEKGADKDANDRDYETPLSVSSKAGY